MKNTQRSTNHLFRIALALWLAALAWLTPAAQLSAAAQQAQNPLPGFHAANAAAHLAAVRAGVGLFRAQEDLAWQPVAGLGATVSDLLVDPADPTLWLAATPAGVQRSRDAGRTWQAISPPWTVWDMAWGAAGRLFLARSNGVAWADDLAATPVDWQQADGLDAVTFFSVDPHPSQVGTLWAGAQGNNVGVSQDGGRTLAPLNNGLETLSALDVLWHPTPGQVTIATIEGLYRTDDGGQNWFKLPGPLAQQTVHSLLQGEDGAIWAGTADGLWVSRDYGATWERAGGGPAATVLRLGQLQLPSQGESWLWAGTEQAGLWLSQDAGVGWRFGGLAGHSLYHLMIDPLDPARLVAATERGIFSTALFPVAAAGGPAKPFRLPFKEPPGPASWLLVQPYGNTVGAYFARNTTYRYSQGIHFGVDLSAPCGTEIVAIADGIVYRTDAISYGSLPHNLIIDHPQLGYASLYGHLLERPNLAPGQEVKAGQVVALSGDPAETCYGRPHLHLEIRDLPSRAWKYNPVPLMEGDWDNLALVGSFRPGFQRDLDNPRKWQYLDDQPAAVTGGAIINNFANPWPADRSLR